MRTLLVTEAPFRDLSYRACTLEAAQAIAHDGPMLLSTQAPGAPPGFLPVPVDEVPPGVEQVVLAGPFLARASLERALATAGAAVAAGASLLVRNLALEGTAAHADPPAGIEVLERAGTLGLRDHRTTNVLTLWRVAAPKAILGYPERHVAPDPWLADALPDGKVLGIAIRGGAEMKKSWGTRLNAIAALLEPARGWPVVVLNIRVPGTGDDDLEATREILDHALPDAPLLFPELEDPLTWRKRQSPARMKALVARCALVLTNRDLPAAYAVTVGTPVIGVALGADRRIISCLATLANELPPGSRLVHPAVG
jgi:hypothetical protein